MLQLAAPLGLLALGALLVPLAIHLVRRPGPVVRVGSLRFLDTARRPARSLRWEERGLLALRCGLLAALALSLAGLQWQPARPASARWVLLAPDAVLEAAELAEWSRLVRDGCEPRWLAAGFPPAHPGREGSAPPAGDAWSLLREADWRLPAGSRAVVFGPTNAHRFQGDRPVLTNLEVSWRATAGRPAAPPVGSPRVALIAAADRAEDARYLGAALSAIGVQPLSDEAPEWIFQLGDVPLPTAWVERIAGGARLVTDPPNAAAAAAVARWFDADVRRAALRQRTALPAGTPILIDSMGDAVLTEERRGAGTHWRSAVRFHPDWTDWPLGSAFPAWWRTQIQAPGMHGSIAPEQAAPGFAPGAALATPRIPGAGRRELGPLCWGIAVGLFGLERALSWYARRRRANV